MRKYACTRTRTPKDRKYFKQIGIVLLELYYVLKFLLRTQKRQFSFSFDLEQVEEMNMNGSEQVVKVVPEHVAAVVPVKGPVAKIRTFSGAIGSVLGSMFSHRYLVASPRSPR